MFSLVGCTKNKNNFSIGKVSNIKILEKGVSLSIKDKTLTNKGVTLILKNDSDYEIQYGASEEIEIKKNGINLFPYFSLKCSLSWHLTSHLLYSLFEHEQGREVKLIGLNHKRMLTIF